MPKKIQSQKRIKSELMHQMPEFGIWVLSLI